MHRFDSELRIFIVSDLQELRLFGIVRGKFLFLSFLVFGGEVCCKQ